MNAPSAGEGFLRPSSKKPIDNGSLRIEYGRSPAMRAFRRRRARFITILWIVIGAVEVWGFGMKPYVPDSLYVYVGLGLPLLLIAGVAVTIAHNRLRRGAVPR
jgi:hypothetical protein